MAAYRDSPLIAEHIDDIYRYFLGCVEAPSAPTRRLRGLSESDATYPSAHPVLNARKRSAKVLP
jgi:hypothetical protein